MGVTSTFRGRLIGLDSDRELCIPNPMVKQAKVPDARGPGELARIVDIPANWNDAHVVHGRQGRNGTSVGSLALGTRPKATGLIKAGINLQPLSTAGHPGGMALVTRGVRDAFSRYLRNRKLCPVLCTNRRHVFDHSLRVLPDHCRLRLIGRRFALRCIIAGTAGRRGPALWAHVACRSNDHDQHCSRAPAGRWSTFTAIRGSIDPA